MLKGKLIQTDRSTGEVFEHSADCPKSQVAAELTEKGIDLNSPAGRAAIAAASHSTSSTRGKSQMQVTIRFDSVGNIIRDAPKTDPRNN